jgi:hypothetical protein
MKSKSHHILIVLLFILVVGLSVYCLYGKKNSAPPVHSSSSNNLKNDIEFVGTPEVNQQPMGSNQNDIEML